MSTYLKELVEELKEPLHYTKGYTDDYVDEEEVKDRMTRAASAITALIDSVDSMQKVLGAYQRERDRFKHNNPEITGAYFLSGGHGKVDDNLLPEVVRIVPAYGCAWEQLYKKTDQTISYEGS